MWQKMLQIGSGGEPVSKEFVLYSRENGFASGFSLSDFVNLTYANIAIDSNNDILVTSKTNGQNGYSYIPIDITNKNYTTLHFSATSVNYGRVGYKVTTAPTQASPTTQEVQPYSGDGHNKDDLQFNIGGMTGTLSIVICGAVSSGGTVYTNPINKIWLD